MESLPVADGADFHGVFAKVATRFCQLRKRRVVKAELEAKASLSRQPRNAVPERMRKCSSVRGKTSVSNARSRQASPHRNVLWRPWRESPTGQPPLTFWRSLAP